VPHPRRTVCGPILPTTLAPRSRGRPIRVWFIRLYVAWVHPLRFRVSRVRGGRGKDESGTTSDKPPPKTGQEPEASPRIPGNRCVRGAPYEAHTATTKLSRRAERRARRHPRRKQCAKRTARKKPGSHVEETTAAGVTARAPAGHASEPPTKADLVSPLSATMSGLVSTLPPALLILATDPPAPVHNFYTVRHAPFATNACSRKTMENKTSFTLPALRPASFST